MTQEERYKKFTDDMEEAGYDVESYQGRNFYIGPSVTVGNHELQDAIRATTVSVQWDNMGKDDLVVYPK